MDELQLGPASREIWDRFWSKVSLDDECWIWLAAERKSDGIGVFAYNGKSFYAHRFAWILTKGPLPAGVQVRRQCGNALCVRPAHLVVVMRPTAELSGLVAEAALLI